MKDVLLDMEAGYEVHQYMNRFHPGVKIIRVIPMGKKTKVFFVHKSA